jgi:hypothetical protein
MEQSILTSTKKALGLDAEYDAFDLDITTHINSVFGILNQLGVGQEVGLYIEDESNLWTEFICPPNQLNMTKTFMYLKVRLLFDPPPTSFGIAALEKLAEEYEVRLNILREEFREEPEIVVEEEE